MAKDNPSSKRWRNKCDALWKRIIKSIGWCEKCGSTDRQLHAHHLITCRRIFFRHNLNNGLCLCSFCHKGDMDESAHEAPWAFDKWFKKAKPAQYRWFAKNKYKTIHGVKVNYREVYETLCEAKPGQKEP